MDHSTDMFSGVVFAEPCPVCTQEAFQSGVDSGYVNEVTTNRGLAGMVYLL